MAGKSPRLSVSLTPSLAQLFGDLSALTGDSASSMVRGLLIEGEPALQRLLLLLRAAKEAKGSINAGLGNAAARVVADLEDAFDLAQGRVDRITRDLVSEAEVVKSRRRRGGGGGAAHGAAGRASAPVPVTRGSGGTKRAKTSSRKGGRS